MNRTRMRISERHKSNFTGVGRKTCARAAIHGASIETRSQAWCCSDRCRSYWRCWRQGGRGSASSSCTSVRVAATLF